MGMFRRILSAGARDLEPEPDDAQTPFKGVESRELARETEAQTAAEIEAWGRHAKMSNGFGDAAVPIATNSLVRSSKMEVIEGLFPATAMPDRDWWAALWPDPEGIARLLGVELRMLVVDLCCGDGYFTAPLARIVEGKVYGVDIDPAMLEQTRTELERTETTVLDLICADARNLQELLPGMVDYVLIANTFHGVPDKTATACAVAAVLKPGGQFAIVNWHRLPRERTVVMGKP